MDIQAELIEEIPQPEQPTDRDATPIDEARDRAILHCAGCQDGAGNTWEAWSSLQGNDTLITLFRVDHATGARTTVATVAPPPTFKLDDFDLWQSGPNLLVAIVAHEAVSSPTRRNIYARAVVPGVAAPYPGGAEPRGAWIDPTLLGANAPAPTPGPVFTVADIVAALTADAAYHAMLQKYAKNGAREAIQTEAVTTPAYLRDQNSLLQVLRDGLAPFIRDRAYEGCMAALDAHTKAETL